MSNTITVPTQDILNTLEYLRGELEAGTMSWGELADLQGLADFIDLDDDQLLEAAGVSEYHHDDDSEGQLCSDDRLCLECRRAAVAVRR